MNQQPTRYEVKLLSSCSAPIAFGDGVTKPDNGTVTFFSPGFSPIAVTNNHVYERLKDRLNGGPGRVVINGLEFDVRQRLIDADPRLDIATFRITNEELMRLGKVPAWQPSPYRMPAVGDGVFLSGYPGKYRKDGDPRRVGFSEVQLSGFVVAQVTSTSVLVSREVSADARVENHAVTYEPGDLGVRPHGHLAGYARVLHHERRDAQPVAARPFNLLQSK
jgi:hypothetical protein